MIDLCLKNCKVVPENLDCSIGIDNGKIVSITKIPPKSSEVIDIKGNPILPGLIDSHVHFRDPGLTYKEDFKTGSEAAVAGGFTTIMDMPNTIPPTDNTKAFLEKLKIANKKSIVDFALHAGVSNLSQIKKIAELRPASFKMFMDTLDNSFLMDAFSEVSRLDHSYPISLHAEDKSVTHCCKKNLKTFTDAGVYAMARPPISEFIAISTAIALSQFYRQNIHICHVSTIRSLQLIFRAQKRGINVTSEVTPHHLLLDASYFRKCGNLVKTNPPLRDKKNKINLSYLKYFDIMGTDHAPHTLEEKEKNVWEAAPGIPNLETTLLLLLTMLNQNMIDFMDIKRVLCKFPAEIFNLENKGAIKEGMDADFVVLDMKKEGIIDPENFRSKAKYSPFKGFKFRGAPVMTIVRGNMVMENGVIFDNNGRHVYSI